MKYLIIIERSESGYSAWCPDLDGCVAAGPTPEEVEESMQEAIKLHLEGLRSQGSDPPEPHAFSSYVDVSA